MDEPDLTTAESKAIYEEIKAYVKKHNLSKPEKSKEPKWPAEKAIMEALRYFKIK